MNYINCLITITPVKVSISVCRPLLTTRLILVLNQQPFVQHRGKFESKKRMKRPK